MTSLEQLAKHFERFPGIGPRQARRFVYHLLTEDPQSLRALADAIADVQAKVTECAHCFRYFARDNGNTFCNFCKTPTRNHELLVVAGRAPDTPPTKLPAPSDGYFLVLGG